MREDRTTSRRRGGIRARRQTCRKSLLAAVNGGARRWQQSSGGFSSSHDQEYDGGVRFLQSSKVSPENGLNGGGDGSQRWLIVKLFGGLGQGAYHLEELNGRRVQRVWNAQHLR